MVPGVAGNKLLQGCLCDLITGSRSAQYFLRRVTNSRVDYGCWSRKWHCCFLPDHWREQCELPRGYCGGALLQWSPKHSLCLVHAEELPGSWKLSFLLSFLHSKEDWSECAKPVHLVIVSLFTPCRDSGAQRCFWLPALELGSWLCALQSEYWGGSNGCLHCCTCNSWWVPKGSS